MSDDQHGATAPVMEAPRKGRSREPREYYVLLFKDGEEYEIHRFKIPHFSTSAGYRPGTSLEWFREREGQRLLDTSGEVLDWWAYAGHLDPRRFDNPDNLPEFHHETIWDMYKAIGYDIKKKRFVGKEILSAEVADSETVRMDDVAQGEPA